MTLLLLCALAGAAEPADATTPPTETVARVSVLEVQALLPTEILVDGVKLGQLWVPGTATFQVPAGEHLVRVYTSGKPHDLPVQMPEGRALRVLVGRAGVSADAVAPDEALGAVPVEFRVMGARGASLRLDDDRHQVQPGVPLAMELEAGLHRLSVRSSDGTVIWATGMLNVVGTGPVVIHVSEGRMPEVSPGGQFHMGSGG